MRVFSCLASVRDISLRLALCLGLCTLASACDDEDPAAAQAKSETDGSEELGARPTTPEPAPVAEVPPQPSAEPSPPPPHEPPFDPAGASHLQARIVDLYKRAGWAPCGVLHSVGAIEVEVLGHGRPRPRMVLFVSCPVDTLSGVNLEVGQLLDVSLYAKAQTWPKPRSYRHELPTRYVRRLSDGVTTE